MDKILVLIEHRDAQILDHNLGALGFATQCARRWNADVCALILSNNPLALSSKLASKKINEIVHVQHEILKNYTLDGYTAVLRQWIEKNSPKMVVFSHTSIGWDVGPSLAASFQAGIVTDISALAFEGSEPIFSRQVYNGKLVEKVKIKKAPYFVTVERGGFASVEEGGAPQVQSFDVSLDNVQFRTEFIGVEVAQKAAVDLAKSNIIVAGGRGVGKKENFHVIEDLAHALGGDFAASRPVVDNEWVERDRQVGSSGKTVAPKLYLACGISGAIQHLSGMKKSNVIVAINKDPHAPIFGVAHFGIVGDLFEIVPALIEEAKSQGIAHR
ncbi:MAG: electron transfer flavoprotein subunit alpha/FixB family protein [Deltaproteobacteria bacterium]|nr:electron transfer flavoprotein subunit alpha/FixB family protein [Deltaproteobacteria bacterium]